MTREAPASGRIELAIPGEDSHLELVRAVVGRAARLAEFSFDGIEDLVLAADEATVLLLTTSPRSVHVRITPEDGGLDVLLHVRGAREPWPPEGLAENTGWQVLQTLCERVWVAGPQPGIGLFQAVR